MLNIENYAALRTSQRGNCWHNLATKCHLMVRQTRCAGITHGHTVRSFPCHFPFCWDSIYWCLQIDGGMLLLLLVCGLAADRAALAAWWATTARMQLTLFYAASAFWKLNTSFLDHRFSCAPIYFVQLLVGYLPGSVVTPELASGVVRLAPCLIVVGESVIGASLLVAAAASPGSRAAVYGEDVRVTTACGAAGPHVAAVGRLGRLAEVA